MSETALPKSVWKDLPDYEKIRKWQDVVPDAAARILTQLEEDAEFLRRNAERRLAYALVIVISTLLAAFVLAMFDKTLPSVFTSSGGAVAVASTLITGRSSAISRRNRGARGKE